ncbi:MAG: hypothetical protein PHY31_06060 [Smithellaceae bacterium]|nr:hypothetical protein [Smithellaceae bacterium]
MIARTVQLFNQYYDQIMVWYHGLDQAAQMGVVFLLFVGSFFLVVFFMMSRMTK